MEMELTKAEEKVMKILWDLESGYIREIVDKYDEPKPAYTTVATIVKILETKGFVDRKAVGNSHIYFPIIAKEEYTSQFMQSFVRNYFSNSFKRLVSEFSQRGDLSAKEMEELINELKKEVQKKKEE